jgi:hypothetical protein
LAYPPRLLGSCICWTVSLEKCESLSHKKALSFTFDIRPIFFDVCQIYYIKKYSYFPIGGKEEEYFLKTHFFPDINPSFPLPPKTDKKTPVTILIYKSLAIKLLRQREKMPSIYTRPYKNSRDCISNSSYWK